MAAVTWFLFDLGNTVIKLAYERVLENLCRFSTVGRDEMVEVLEQQGGYRDLERGLVTFWEFYEFLTDRAGYSGSPSEFQTLWGDFFDGPVPGIEEILDRVRRQYRIAFLSNSNELHAELIPRKFAALFKKDDRFIFSYRFKCAKPDPEMFQRALEVCGALPHHAVFIDDLIENVYGARALGMTAYQFRDSLMLGRELERDGFLPPSP
jgi:putative hydrolase of the HAD superfamily